MDNTPPGFPVLTKQLTLDIQSLRIHQFWGLLALSLCMIHLIHHFNFALASNSTSPGNQTHFVICAYEDYFLVIATQIGSMGTILQATKEEGVTLHPTFTVSVLIGKRDEPMLVACARKLIQNISEAGSSKSLVLSLGLKDHSADSIKAVVSAVTENRIW